MLGQQNLPKNVQRFEWLMYGSILLGLVIAPFNSRVYEAIDRYGVGILVVGALLTGLNIFLIWLIARRQKNWVRWLMIVLFVLALFSLPATIQEIGARPLSGWTQALILTMRGLGYFFIFTGDASSWFKPEPVEAVFD